MTILAPLLKLQPDLLKRMAKRVCFRRQSVTPKLGEVGLKPKALTEKNLII